MRAAKLALLVLALIAGPSFSQPTGPPISGGGGAADPLTVLGPASVCADNQLARWNGASNTALQCSPLVVADTTGTLTLPNTGLVRFGGGTNEAALGLKNTYELVVTDSAGTGIRRMYAYEFGAYSTLAGGATTTYSNDGILSSSPNFKIVSWGTGSAVSLHGQNITDSRKLEVYGGYVNDSNYERLSITPTPGVGATIGVETAGTGADNLDLILKPAGTGQFYIGAGGTTAAAPASVVVNATGGSGTDIAGASLTLAGGKGTGNAAGGSVVIQTSDPGSTGTTLQTLATRVTVGVARTTIANILSLTGIAAAPGSPAAGDIVYDSVNNLFCGYNGSAWVSFSGAGTCWAE